MGKIFVRGLIAITPLALTVALVIWIFAALENTFSVPLKHVVGAYYFPGLGILVALVCIFIIGTVINNFLIQKIYSWGEKLLKKIPFIKTLYSAIADVTQFFDTSQKNRLGAVVTFHFQGLQGLGFVTRETFEDFPENMTSKDQVAVYIPFSYQIGGFTFFIPKKELTRVDITVEEAMRFIITAGILKDPNPSKKEPKKKEELYDY